MKRLRRDLAAALTGALALAAASTSCSWRREPDTERPTPLGTASSSYDRATGPIEAAPNARDTTAARPNRRREQERAWVHQVLLGTEFGGDGAICARWARPPTLSVHGANELQSAEIDHVLARLNTTLGPLGFPIRRGPDESDADIDVHFVPLAKMAERARELGFPYEANNHGYFWGFWNDAHEYYRGDVLLASDALSGARLRHFAFEEITQSLGPANDSPLFEDSVFFARGSDGGKAPTLSTLDDTLLRFLYTAVRPGSRNKELDAAFDRWWP